jgi:hypothetical protein
MKIRISTTSPDHLKRDTLILGFFSDERPPRGYCGLMDWRLNGAISTELAQGRISGDYLDMLLYAFPKRVQISRLLLFGLGPLSEMTYDRLYNSGYEMARTVLGMQAKDLAIPLPAVGRSPLKIPAMAEALLTGIFDGFSGRPEELSSLFIEMPVQTNHADEIGTGLHLFRQRVGAALCEILNLKGEIDNRPETFRL